MKLIEAILLLIVVALLTTYIICMFHMAIEFILKEVDKEIKQNDKNTKNKN